ncbi:MAG: efflux RND transporter periplasmic adaptor subunit [Betaproteobacteria bacterium]|nr:efflux RND transporter periplasmic adaptor subunit [Betaproteobacteria bacterium]
MRIASFLVGFFLSFVGGALAQAPKDAAKGSSATLAMSVKVAAARIAPAVDEVGAVGTLRADEAVTIRPEIAGRIAEICFNEGQNIARGAVLVKLDSTELAAVLASSVAQARLDRQRLERSEDLYQKSFISQQALDESRSGYARSLAKQKEDEARLAKTEMRASFPGVAGLRQVSEGQYVAAGADIARLEKIDQLKLDFRIPESYISKLKVGQPVKVLVDAYADRVFPGSVYAIEPGVDEQTRTIQLRARLANLELRLRPGMFARVRVQLGVREKAIWIPEAAIVPKGQDTTVFRVLAGPDGGGKVDVVRVQTGMRKVGEVEIVKGLAAGDLVVTEGTQKIGPGSAVVLMGTEPPKK